MADSIPAVIAKVLRDANKPMSPGEIREAICERKLYVFKARDPLHIVSTQLRRHCLGLDFPSARPVKWFRRLPDGRYDVLPTPQRIDPTLYEVRGDAEAGPATLVSVPPDEPAADPELPGGPAGPTHTEMQWRLLDLGAQLGFQVWAPMADRGKVWGERQLAEVSGMVKNLPLNVSKVVRETIEYIDVLWLDKQAIVSGFEVEHSTPIYSGLLRLSDLLTLLPNFDVKMFVVAAIDRIEQFAKQVNRPTFSMRRKPLHEVCRFLAYERLLEQLDKHEGVIHRLKPEFFLDDLAESCGPAADADQES